jgi:hypothetical protein
MLSADARFTVASLNRLKDAARKGRRIVVWVGAGLIYPLDTTLQSKYDKHSPEMSLTSQTILRSRWSTRKPTQNSSNYARISIPSYLTRHC